MHEKSSISKLTAKYGEAYMLQHSNVNSVPSNRKYSRNTPIFLSRDNSFSRTFKLRGGLIGDDDRHSSGRDCVERLTDEGEDGGAVGARGHARLVVVVAHVAEGPRDAGRFITRV